MSYLAMQAIGSNVVILDEWAIKTKQVSNNKLTVGFRHRPAQWKMVRAGFWASSRQDIIVGALTASIIIYK